MPGTVAMALTDLFGRAFAGFVLQAFRVFAAFAFDTGMDPGFSVAFANLLRRTVRRGARQVPEFLAVLHLVLLL